MTPLFLLLFRDTVHLDPEGGSGAKSEAMERKARTLPNKSKKGGGSGGGSGGGEGGRGSSGRSDGVGGGYPLTDAVMRGVVTALRDIGPAPETTVLIAAHGKGKSDGAAALVTYMKRHAPELAERVVGGDILAKMCVCTRTCIGNEPLSLLRLFRLFIITLRHSIIRHCCAEDLYNIILSRSRLLNPCGGRRRSLGGRQGWSPAD